MLTYADTVSIWDWPLIRGQISDKGASRLIRAVRDLTCVLQKIGKWWKVSFQQKKAIGKSGQLQQDGSIARRCSRFRCQTWHNGLRQLNVVTTHDSQLDCRCGCDWKSESQGRQGFDLKACTIRSHDRSRSCKEPRWMVWRTRKRRNKVLAVCARKCKYEKSSCSPACLFRWSKMPTRKAMP